MGPAALEDSDFTARVNLATCRPGSRSSIASLMVDLADLKLAAGRSRALADAAGGRRDIRFVWSGDTAGQGWGINLDWGGMKIYETMRKDEPDFFIHSGDTIYADGPIEAEEAMPDGTIWKNVTTEEKAKVAETLAEFRGNYKYNMMDENLRRFNAEVPMFAQWDDHEVTTTGIRRGPRRRPKKGDYEVNSVACSRRAAARAFLEYMPMRLIRSTRSASTAPSATGPRSNLPDRHAQLSRPQHGEPAGRARRGHRVPRARQIRWLKQELLASKATWKVIAADMPIGLIVPDGELPRTAPTATGRRSAASSRSRGCCASSERTASRTWSG